MAVLRTEEPAGRRYRRRRSQLPLLLFAVAAAGLSTTAARAQSSPDEYQVKAAYILNFARFVEWPPDALPASSPIAIAIVGEDSFGGALEEVLRGKSANGHPIQLRHLRWDEELATYQIVFISNSEEPHLPQILRYLAHSSALTVSDIDRFSLRGGIIEFCMVGNRVRFDINREPAIAAQLIISSKLLSVARAVHNGGAAK
jgi:hypothetical protein